MEPNLNEALAAKLARLALDCVTREYPNKIAHLMKSDSDVLPPRQLTPAFYGCFDWHSAVHGHWTLARLARLFPDAAFAAEARAALARNLTPENIASEAAYSRARPGFERPYGIAWLLALATEVDIGLLTDIAVAQITAWLPKLARPDRSGQHANTAFAMGLMLDWARGAGAIEFERLLVQRAMDFFAADRDAPVSYEPSGEDFLSPSLAEADLMRRVLPAQEFAEWFAAFLPNGWWLEPVRSTDPSDGKLAHFDGLNLSRAWMLRSISGAVPDAERFTALAKGHADAGLAAVTGTHYEGAHWLATFAVYLLTSRNRTRVRLVEHDPRWTEWFTSERARIQSALGAQALTIEHVGSTSVAGLIAKPVIDVVLAVRSAADEASYVPQLEAAGHSLHVREPHWYEHRLLKGPGPDINLHVFSEGCPEIDRMLRFRNRLRNHEADREFYGNTKRKLAERDWLDIQSYADAKTAVIEEILARAG